MIQEAKKLMMHLNKTFQGSILTYLATFLDLENMYNNIRPVIGEYVYLLEYRTFSHKKIRFFSFTKRRSLNYTMAIFADYTSNI